MTVKINIADQYTTHPLGRFKSAWPFSGQRFREEFLEKPLHAGENVIVDINGTKGLAPSFLEEAFGGLIPTGLSPEKLKSLLTIVGDDQARIEEIWFYIESASATTAQ